MCVDHSSIILRYLFTRSPPERSHSSWAAPSTVSICAPLATDGELDRGSGLPDLPLAWSLDELGVEPLVTTAGGGFGPPRRGDDCDVRVSNNYTGLPLNVPLRLIHSTDHYV
ncbi:hypothetical protein J6590_090600 [Homalodisca vitripennis]|nr:hypothetical protein J6590_090600 [Homalodisca vitripennis]